MNKLIIFTASLFLFSTLTYSSVNKDFVLEGFSKNKIDEQVATFCINPDIRVHINAPKAVDFNTDKPVAVAFYALPNGNTIEQTIGKILKPGDDWHFDIQHIGAQTRFLRNKVKDYNLVIAYLETDQKSWPAWKNDHSDYRVIVKSVVDTVLTFFKDFETSIILTGHSGGGRFIFSFIDVFDEIPNNVKRICFLDSNYGYEESVGMKITKWLKNSDEHYLSVLAYNDSVVTYNNKPLVSSTGGTWYRSKIMYKDLSNNFVFIIEENEDFIKYISLQGRINIFLKKNPFREILHTVQVELNGFIHSMLSGTLLENNGYEYFREKAYKEYIQP